MGIKGFNGAQNCFKREVFHRHSREVEERLLPRMYRAHRVGDEAWRVRGAPVRREQQPRDPQERGPGEDRGHVPADPPPGTAPALHFQRKQTPGAAL